MHKMIDFPNLGIHLESVGDHITVFGFDIAFYGIIIGCAIMVGIMIAVAEAKRTGQNPEDYMDLAIYAVIEKMFPKKSKVMSDKNMSLIKEKITEVSDELKNGEFDDANSTENCAKLLNMILLENEKSENDN